MSPDTPVQREWQASIVDEPASIAPATRPLIVAPELNVLDGYHWDPIAQFFGPSAPAVVIVPSVRFLFICFTNRWDQVSLPS
jgi:hypothetical protein